MLQADLDLFLLFYHKSRFAGVFILVFSAHLFASCGVVWYEKRLPPFSGAALLKIQDKAGVFSTAAEAINFAIHSSACEGMTTPSEDIDNLRRLARGEISADTLIQQYISEAIEENQKIHAR